MRSIRGPALLALATLLLPLAPLAAGGTSAPARKGQPAAPAKAAKLTAKQIVERHVAARGGLAAWRAVQTMSWNGKMDVGAGDSVTRSTRFMASAPAGKGKGARVARAPAESHAEPRQQIQVPFVVELKRPGKSRVEIEFAGKTAVQVFDGKSGWMQRPYLNRDDWQPFTAEQAKAQGGWDIDGPLIDHAAKGTKVELASVERVDGHDAYKLKLTHKSGEVQHVWIDAKTFLDVKFEGKPRRMDGKLRTVWIAQRDFRKVEGVMVPFTLETAVDGYADTHKVSVAKVALNPRLDDARFSKPRT
jgi:hypothetical protein